jgi:hypothetical protein
MAVVRCMGRISREWGKDYRGRKERTRMRRWGRGDEDEGNENELIDWCMIDGVVM